MEFDEGMEMVDGMDIDDDAVQVIDLAHVSQQVEYFDFKKFEYLLLVR